MATPNPTVPLKALVHSCPSTAHSNASHPPLGSQEGTELPSGVFSTDWSLALHISRLLKTAVSAAELPFADCSWKPPGYKTLLLSSPEGACLLKSTEVGSLSKHPVFGVKGIFFLLLQKAGETSLGYLQERGWNTTGNLHFSLLPGPPKPKDHTKHSILHLVQ